MIEKVVHKKKLFALIIKGNFKKKRGITFFTKRNLPQQLGYMKRKKGYIIEPHIHNKIPREITLTQEVLILRKGKVRVDFYNDDKRYSESSILYSGDIILLANGGHGFSMLEESEIIEVKQGPYLEDKDKEKFNPLMRRIKNILKDKVKDVTVSNRLMNSPSCIVVDQNDPSIQMQEIMKRMGNTDSMPEVKPILEINPNHKIISKMNKMGKTKKFKDVCYLLFDQALLVEGIDLSSPTEFVSRLNIALEKSL